MEVLIAVGITALWAAVFITVLVILNRKISSLQGEVGSDKSLHFIKQDLTDIHRTLNHRLDKSNSVMQEAMARQFAASSRLISEVTRDLTELKESNKRVMGVTDELKLLQNILQNPKQRGVLGEYFLQTVLENVLPPDRYQLQYRFTDGETVDAVVFLDRGQILPVDSKFSLENYNRLVEEGDKSRREGLIKAVRSDLKARIDETAKYIRPNERTMDFAFMFIPSEAIYYDLLVNKIGSTEINARDLIEYAFRDKHVVIVSPTSFMAYLQTVLQGLRSLKIEERAKEIQKRIEELGRHVQSHEVFMRKLGVSLGTTINHYNAAHKSLRSMDMDVVKIAQSEPAVENIVLDRPQTDE